MANPSSFISMSASIDPETIAIRKYSKVVARLQSGAGFGELAIVNDARRAASIITTSYTILLNVEKRDYNQILRAIHNQELREKLSFLKKIPDISRAFDLKNLADASSFLLSSADKLIDHDYENL